MLPYSSYSVTKHEGEEYLVLDALSKSKGSWIRVVSKSSAPEPILQSLGLAVFNASQGAFCSRREWYLAVCDVPMLESESPIELGNRILKKMEALAARFTLLTSKVNFLNFPVSFPFRMLTMIERTLPNWLKQLDGQPEKSIVQPKDLYHWERKVVVTPAKRVFMHTGFCICSSQKEVTLLVDALNDQMFVIFKPILNCEVEFLVKLDREKRAYKRILEEHQKKTDLEGILVPETILRYERNNKIKEYVVLPKKPCDLYDYLLFYAIPEDKLSKVVYQMIKGVMTFQELFEEVHGDIRPKNFLIDPETFEVFLIDFGIVYPKGKNKMLDYLGTPWYKPPEAFRPRFSVVDFDKWSSWTLGMALTNVVEGFLNFQKLSNDETFELFILELNEYLERPMKNKEFEPILKGLLQVMPESRLSIKEAFKMVRAIYKKP